MSPKPKSSHPIGSSTRGKTAANRLRRTDIFLSRYAPNLIEMPNPTEQIAYFVDHGYGSEPLTTLESAKRFRKLNPNLPVLGIEIDPERVEKALPYNEENTHFRLGGFNLPLKQNETARMIRSFNVLRQYEENKVREALLLLAKGLIIDGILFEGTSDPFGRLWVANLFRKTVEDPIRLEGLVFSTNFRWGFEPDYFQPVLPKNLIHKMVEGEPIYKFFSVWKEAAKLTIAYKEYGLRQWFVAAALTLAELGYSIDQRKKMLKNGFLVWKYPDLVIE